MGYTIPSTKELDSAILHVAIANGDIDFTAAHWEWLYSAFYQENQGGDTMKRVGHFVPDGLQGYLIDKATAEAYNITHLNQLQDPEIAQLFDMDRDGKADLTGCNLGWSCEMLVGHHLEAYNLTDTVEQDHGKYDALLANIVTNFQQGNSILYYSWSPYWIHSALKPEQDVVWLQVSHTSLPNDLGTLTEVDTTVDGKNLGFPVDQQRFLVNTEFLAANPAAAKFFELARIPAQDINDQNLLIQQGEDTEADIRAHAEVWVAEHEAIFDGWVQSSLDEVRR